ncbi:zinc finger transcription factor ace1 [Paracoccidioides lutzii Pb01]|uniref:Zinc finger transcription factor ace1 n=1 Tax=Paracoccidioides lutzii (strain ATCC MYA-826 / Pb01) TaxID=502779 RepID=C1GT70_PARBA|nr:zinc finger transcription factor ace1 [Paracoccidioides lutzii Pb01]EEH39253.2 zinc finger transcription factor ace1 [Paracoccidioides lutzii Pb01]
MSAPRVHPRRRPIYNSAPIPRLPTSSSPLSSSSDLSDPACRHSALHSMQLRKGATFHSPTTPPSPGTDPILNIHSLLRRSPTCPRSLEDVIAAGEKRMAVFIDKFERNLSGLGTCSPSTASSSSSSSSSSPRNRHSILDDDDLPVPRAILDAHVIHADTMDTDSTDSNHCKPLRIDDSPAMNSSQHASDSGLGTSVSGTSNSASIHSREKAIDKMNHSPKDRKSLQEPKMASTQSAITRSISSNTLEIPTFGVAARKNIDRFILNPILLEKRLTPFHPLARGVPERIENKEITCLRDLEKTLLFLAPVSQLLYIDVSDCTHTLRNHIKKFTTSKASYIAFCEFTIQCLHTTVGYLNERDQRRPSDRPYTNGYFLDLVEQIRQYASMISAARERQGPRPRSRDGENNKDYSSDEELTLEGGLAATGRPAELVRRKKNQAISLRTREPYEERASPVIPMMKRSLSTESCDDSVTRSMARRKKNAPPLDINQKCKDCDKVFKRPCDLTKHEKTHSRPWKCDERSCKYFEIGWPTEKERDRHVNDKHSKSPQLYRCQFPPCTYQSKRDSNRKQHMEKAHGWVYVRSKNNGKASSRVSSSHTPHTPQTPIMKTPNSGTVDIPTPLSHPALSPYLANVSPYEQSLQYNAPGSGTYPLDDLMDPQNQDFQLFPDAMDDFNAFVSPMDFSAFEAHLAATDPNQYIPNLDIPMSSSASSTSTAPASALLGSGLIDENPFDPRTTTPNFDVDFDNMDSEYITMNMQLLTPAQSVEVHGLSSFSRNTSVSGLSPGSVSEQKVSSNLSPTGQGNLMLYSPNSQQNIDEGFHDAYGNHSNNHMGKPNGDFTLFESPADTTTSAQNFPTLNNFSDDHYSADDAWGVQIDPMDMHREADEYMMDY